MILIPHVPAMLDLIQRTLADEERPDAVARLAIGLLGDIADAFPNGQVKDYLLADWVIGALKVKGRGRELKTTVRWAKEVRSWRGSDGLLLTVPADGQAGDAIDETNGSVTIYSLPSPQD